MQHQYINQLSDNVQYNELWNKMIESEYEYLKFVRSILTTQFIDETADYVYDTTHWYYEYFLKDNGFIDSDNKFDKSKNVKELYHKLSIICHPDKCNEPWAHDVFVQVYDAYSKNNETVLQKLINHWNENQTFDGYIDTPVDRVESHEQVIQKWKSEIWYQWFQPNSFIRDFFIPQDLHDTRLKHKKNELLVEKIKLTNECEKLELESEKLELENKKLRESIHSLYQDISTTH